jgi:hypothetical protein
MKYNNDEIWQKAKDIYDKSHLDFHKIEEHKQKYFYILAMIELETNDENYENTK